MKELYEKIRETENKIYEMSASIDEIMQKLQIEKEKIENNFKKITETVQALSFNPEKLKDFWEQPYALIPRKPDEWYVISPTFVDFQIGWLEKTIKGWNYFIVNKYVNWLANIPKDLKEKFNFKEPLPLKVFDHMLLTGKYQDEAWKRYSKHLARREGKDKIKVKKGHEFKLIADMISDGILPFIPQPIKKEDLREPDFRKNIELRSYQKDAWEKFMQFGAIGVYWAFGSGKTIIGIYALAHLKDQKLIVVPTTTLKEQWNDRINTYIPQYREEIEIETYHAWNKLKNREFSLIIFDECHRLPANTFSRLATLKTDYRMGLSATPYREDGRTDLIFALTGFPTGMDWREIMEMGVIGKPTVTLYILDNNMEKIRKIEELIKDDKKTIIYSYWLELGEKISKKLNIPFVYGATKNRLDIINNSNICVISSVGGEGLSIPELERIIEVGFLYGSRREEGQLMGRLFHSTEDEPEHIILMTEEELEKYEKRLLAIYEKGFRINIIR